MQFFSRNAYFFSIKKITKCFFSTIDKGNKPNQEIGQLAREFEILNISPKSQIKEIHLAYKRYAMLYNPKVYMEHDVNHYS